MKKLLLLILLLTVMAVSCNRSVTTDTVNEESNTTTKTYQDIDTGVGFQYPGNWEFVEPTDDYPYSAIKQARSVGYIQSPEVKNNVIEFAFGATLSVYHQPSLSDDVKSETAPQGEQEQKFEAEGFIGAISTYPGTKENNGAILNYKSSERIEAYKVFPNGELVVIVWDWANLDNQPTDLSYQKYLLPILSSISIK